ncbi:serine hydrolase [Aurantiacibacter arachoides]|uniref:serine hydrolase n=1 Tax=Aurantiacibacter arachoides TaxID=1850444 RepID=UPI0019C6AD84|nr:serine hydrolase [Aurantiacibacter arachoides]GGD53291.1 hypothetical protein GCM10011411_11470 [Aurantiacibacter arachoides]
MTAVFRTIAALVPLAALAACGQPEQEGRPSAVVSADEDAANLKASPAPAQPEPEPVAASVTSARSELTALLGTIASDFGGTMGIAVVDVDSGWTTGINDRKMLPQQSVSKLWVALTALDQVDRGRLTLGKRVVIEPEDLTVFHQPLREQVLRTGSLATDPLDLLTRALTRSDNTANDALLWTVGGPDAVRAMLREKAIANVRFGPGERLLQSGIAGLQWQQEWASTRQGFFDARDAVPAAARKRAFESYLADPVDGATPRAIATALARLARGDLLSPASTERMIAILRETHSGPRRLKGGVGTGWSIAHKTGTGQYYDGRQSGYNDVALLFAPDGRAYAVAVMIGETRKGVPQSMAMMQAVTRAVEDYDATLRADESLRTRG